MGQLYIWKHSYVKMIQRSVVGIGVAAIIAALCLAAFAADSSRTEKIPAAIDAAQYADFMESEAFDLVDLAEGAEIQRRMFNRMTPSGFSWLQPMFPSVVPFDAAGFEETFLADLLGEDRNSVAVYPLSLALDPKTRETLVYNADGKLIATLPADGISRTWPEDADPARVTLQLDLLPSEDVEPYLYVGDRISEFTSTSVAKSVKLPKTGGITLKSLSVGQFGFAAAQKLANGNFRLTVTNGADVAEVYSYTVWHTSSVVVVTWTNEESNVVTDTNTLWTPVSPPYNGLESEWDLGTTNLVLTNGVGVWEDSNISSNARVRFYGAAKQADTDWDGLTDGLEYFVHHTSPTNSDTDGDGWSDAEELAEETDPLDRFSAARLARGVVINEVLYDPTGTDTNKEWIELYSAGRYPVDLGGFIIQVGATTNYANAYTLPTNTLIDPGTYLLLGGSWTNHDLEAAFGMPNRNYAGPTAAVRLAAEVGTNDLVADCLMYGGTATNFNLNQLDTTGWLDAEANYAFEGKSLVRRFTGHDSDRVRDWLWTNNPVANSSNQVVDTDGDGFTDEVELTGSENPLGDPTDPLDTDTDGDGLDDHAECTATNYTNPLGIDSDGDMFPWSTNGYEAYYGNDWYEVNISGTDPNVNDTDGDGIPDGWESAMGLDPTSDDTNNTGTPDGERDTDNDGVSNADEVNQNSNPTDPNDKTAHPYLMKIYHLPKPGWADGMNMGLNQMVGYEFTNIKVNTTICAIITEGEYTPEEFSVRWDNVLSSSQSGDRTVITCAQVESSSTPHLTVVDLASIPNLSEPEQGADIRVAVLKVELVPDSGKVHHGFDPPNSGEGDPEDEPYWASVVQGGENTIVNLEIAPASIASQIECQIVPGGEAYVDIEPKTYSAATTALTITGKTGLGSSIYEPTIQFVLNPSGNILKTLKVMVLPEWTVEAGLYSLEDSASAGTDILGIPSWNDCIVVCNDIFKQAGVRFSLHSSSGSRTYPYDTRGFSEVFPGVPIYGYDETVPPRTPDGAMTADEWTALTSTYYDEGVPVYTAPSLSLFECSTLDDTVSMVVVNAGEEPYSGTGPPYIRGSPGHPGVVYAKNLVSNEHLKLAIAHEIGHRLALSTAGEDGGHDIPPYSAEVADDLPNGVPGVQPGPAHGGTLHLDEPENAIMASGNPVGGKLPWLHGRWMRHEDWKAANEAAEALVDE